MADNGTPTQMSSIESRLETLCKKVDSLSSMSSTLQELQQSVNFMNTFFDDYKTQMQELITVNTALRKKLEVTESKLKAAEEEIDDLQQYTHGIPETQDEDTDKIVMKVANAVGVSVAESDIDISHRLPKRQGQHTSTIIVRFTRRSVRNNLYKSKKHLRNKNASDIGLRSPVQQNSRIYINEQLTTKNKKLFHEVNKRKTARWKYIWTQNGHIYLRKEDSSPVVKMKSYEDLHHIK
ncbi:uncharacterized protein [Ptychodera flava]|uniref:uncharacterized protein n=1 Tax=Ptychodera flava TaxID=63121 RepID=UPI00396A5B65